jgi:putative acetyltransferase
MVREYQPKDLEELLEAWQAASTLAHPFLSRDFMTRERKLIAEVFLPNSETWVFEREGRAIGFISLSLQKNEVGGLFVDPQHHGTGAGRALMDKAREHRGTLEVEVFEANEIGRSFYRRYGFELFEEKLDEATGFPMLRLRLPVE